MPFHHSARQAKLVNELAPHLFQPPSLEGDSEVEEGEKKIDKLTEQVPVSWKDTDVLIMGHRHLKGKVGMVTDVHICKSSPSGLVIKVCSTGCL